MEHTPPKIVCSSETNPQAVTSPRQSDVTITAGANAIGNSIPRFMSSLGKDGVMSSWMVHRPGQLEKCLEPGGQIWVYLNIL